MAHEDVDQKDREIITELILNSRQTVGELSKKIGIPPTTIHNRIKKLEKDGIILNYTANIDYKKLGKPITGYIGITVNYHVDGRKIKQLDVAKEIKSVEGVTEVAIVTGGIDIIVKVLAKDIDDLNRIVTEKLREIDGADRTQTMIVLKRV